MIRFDDQQKSLSAPWIIGTANAPVRPQIWLHGLDYKSIRDALAKGLRANQRSTPGGATSISDPTLALADAWAVVADILGFYQSRVVNESYVGTARENGSVFQLARMVAYAPDQGLAATCYVYYTIDESVARDVRIPAGSKIRAMPQPGEEPQTFETRKDLIARSSWNVIRPATTRNAEVDLDTSKLYLARTDGGIKPNDLLLARRIAPEEREIYFVARAVTFDRQADQTVVDVARRYPPADASIPDQAHEGTKAPTKVAFDSSFADELARRNRDPSTTAAYYQSQMQDQGWIEANVASMLARQPAARPDVEVIGFRKRAMVFGHNAPQRPDPGKLASGDKGWPIDSADLVPDVIDLEGHLPGVLPESTLCIEIPNRSALSGDLETYTVKTVQLTSRTAYGMTGDITRLTLDRPWKAVRRWNDFQEAYEEVVQRVTVHLDDVNLRLGLMPITAVGGAAAKSGTTGLPSGEKGARVAGNGAIEGEGQAIELDALYFDLEPGRRMILHGDPPPGEAPAKTREPELVTILRINHPSYPRGNSPTKQEDAGSGDPSASAEQQARPPRTIVTFAEKLKYRYDPANLKIYGNVVEASHGETYEEVLGSGDGAREHQSFALTRKPLTQLPIPAFPGAEAEIGVRIAGDEWRQVATLASAGAEQRAFALWTDETSTTRAIFGSGRVGARLPTGRENVVARYRVGLGQAGNIKRERLKLAVDHPLGVQGVSNIRAGGGSDPEPLARVRINTPLSTVALDRLVSRGDYLSFARTYPGVAKAKASYKPTPAGDVMVISILNDPIAALAADDPLCKALADAMAERGDGSTSLFVTPGLLCPLYIAATVKILPDKPWDDVAGAIRAALVQAFGFEGRELGQAAHASEVLALIQTVDDVEFATLREFHRYDPEAKAQRPSSPSIDAAQGGFDENGKLTRAELLLLQPHIPSTIVLEPDLS